MKYERPVMIIGIWIDCLCVGVISLSLLSILPTVYSVYLYLPAKIHRGNSTLWFVLYTIVFMVCRMTQGGLGVAVDWSRLVILSSERLITKSLF